MDISNEDTYTDMKGRIPLMRANTKRDTLQKVKRDLYRTLKKSLILGSVKKENASKNKNEKNLQLEKVTTNFHTTFNQGQNRIDGVSGNTVPIGIIWPGDTEALPPNRTS